MANPSVAGPLNHGGDWGLYALADHTVWPAVRAASVCSHVAALPRPTAILLSYYVDGGAGIKGLLPGRGDEVLTFGAAFARISADAAALDQDTLTLNGAPVPDPRLWTGRPKRAMRLSLRHGGSCSRICNTSSHSGGHVPDPGNANVAVPNAWVAGVRSTIKF